MTAYWIVFAIMFLLQFIIKVDTQRGYLWKLIITFIPLFIYGAFRVDYGLDYAGYEEFFDRIHQNGLKDYERERIEYGYGVLNFIMPSFRSLIILLTALICTSYIFLFYKVLPPKYLWLAILLLFLSGDKTIFFMFSGLRNSISISILILSVPLLKERKLLLFLLCMFLASLFHKTAFIFFPIAYFISSNKNITRKEIAIWVGVFIFFWIFSAISMIEIVETFTNYFLGDRYDSYIEQINELGDNRGLLIRIASVILFIPIIVFCTKHSFSAYGNVIMRLGLMYLMTNVLGSLNYRASHHFMIFFIVLLSYILKYSKDNLFKYGYILFVIAFLSYAFFVVYIGNPLFPYDVYESTIFGMID